MLSDNVQYLGHLDIITSELASEQEKDSFSTEPVLDLKPTRPMSIQEHINLNKMNKVQIMRPMSILDHINMSIHSIEMPFKSTPSFHFNRIEELKYEKPVEEVCMFDDYPCYLDKVIRDYLATLTPRIVQIESYCEGDCDDDELLFQTKYEDEVTKVCEKIYVEEQNNSSNHCEKIKHTKQNCKNICMGDEPLFLNELFKDECNHSEKTCVDNLKFRVLFEKRKLELSIFTFDDPTNDQSFDNAL